jgi:hypothetical protein
MIPSTSWKTKYIPICWKTKYTVFLSAGRRSIQYSYLLEDEVHSIPIWPNYIFTYCITILPTRLSGRTIEILSQSCLAEKYQIPYLVEDAGI